MVAIVLCTNDVDEPASLALAASMNTGSAVDGGNESSPRIRAQLDSRATRRLKFRPQKNTYKYLRREKRRGVWTQIRSSPPPFLIVAFFFFTTFVAAASANRTSKQSREFGTRVYTLTGS